ncbi:LuxR C-terminal-related transcriptional regulator [Lentzea sp. NPDC060358]|uniref:LuxR C-terminal-related transcriptional regulator n=1 Tax=Lentzea sp. NPDC060358 TaxID=3347103 RepID=UPI003662F92A
MADSASGAARAGKGVVEVLDNTALDAIRRTRVELIRNGRWKEAELLAGAAVARAVGAGGPVAGLSPADLAYVPGCPGPGEAPPAVREAVFRAVQAANRGAGRSAAVDAARQALTSAQALDAATFWQAVTVLVHAGEAALAHRHWACSAHRHGRDVHDLLGGRIAVLRRAPRTAVRLLDGALGRGVGPRSRVAAVAWLVLALVEAGELGRAHGVAQAERRAGAPAEHPDGAELHFARGRLLLAEGRAAAALEEFLDCGRHIAAWGVANPVVLPWRSAAALAAAGAGDLVLARICADKDLVAARRWGAPRGVGLALHAVALARGGDDVLLEEAVTCLGKASTADESLRARHDLAQLLLARGEAERARGHTRYLREEAGTAACPQWTRSADELTHRLLRTDGESALSGQQRRIALLARAGRSNREIAAELNLTLRTVEFHLTSVYRKMGVEGRPGLRRAFVPTA